MAVTVRRARKADAKKIGELAIKLAEQHRAYDARRFSELAPFEQAANYYGSQTEAADARVLIAEFENEIVGIAFLQYEAKDYANLLENAVWLHDIYIEERARGANAGNLLIEKSIEAAEELGADKLMLSVAVKNEHAKAFFRRKGFRETMVEMMFDLNER